MQSAISVQLTDLQLMMRLDIHKLAARCNSFDLLAVLGSLIHADFVEVCQNMMMIHFTAQLWADSADCLQTRPTFGILSPGELVFGFVAVVVVVVAVVSDKASAMVRLVDWAQSSWRAGANQLGATRCKGSRARQPTSVFVLVAPLSPNLLLFPPASCAGTTRANFCTIVRHKSIAARSARLKLVHFCLATFKHGKSLVSLGADSAELRRDGHGNRKSERQRESRRQSK